MSVEEIAGYNPPAVDLSPFRAGTIWHYQGRAYLVVGCSYVEWVGQRADHYLTGNTAHVEVYQAGPAELRMRLERAEWADPMPSDRDLTGWDHGHSKRQRLVDGRCWRIGDFRPVMWTSPPLDDTHPARQGALWEQLEVTLWRSPSEDL